MIRDAFPLVNNPLNLPRLKLVPGGPAPEWFQPATMQFFLLFPARWDCPQFQPTFSSVR